MFGKPNRIVSTHRVSKADGTRTTTLVTNTYEGAPYNLTDLPGVHEHDSAYNTNFGYRGNVVGSTTPAATKVFQHDIGGNVTSTTVNGVYSTVATSSSTNYAAPSQMTTNTLSSTANWTSALGLSSAAGPNGDTASFGYDSNGRPTSTTSPTRRSHQLHLRRQRLAALQNRHHQLALGPNRDGWLRSHGPDPQRRARQFRSRHALRSLRLLSARQNQPGLATFRAQRIGVLD